MEGALFYCARSKRLYPPHDTPAKVPAFPRSAAGRIMGGVRSPLRWWTGLSPRRRLLLGGLALVSAAVAVVIGVQVSGGQPEPVAGRPGAVLLVPGYGGSVASLDGLAARIKSTGRTATVVPLAGNGTGDLAVQARDLNGYVNSALAAGSGPV